MAQDEAGRQFAQVRNVTEEGKCRPGPRRNNRVVNRGEREGKLSDP